MIRRVILALAENGQGLALMALAALSLVLLVNQ